MKARRRTPGRQSGFTLMELLLAFLIFSMVIAVFSQAVFQISLFARSTTRTASMWQQRWATGFALDEAFRTLVLPPAAGAQPVTTGTTDQFSTWWVEASGDVEGRPIHVVLSLRALVVAPEAGAGLSSRRWGLFLKRGDAEETLVGRWDYPVSFRFHDSKGSSYTVWPVPLRSTADVRDEALPRAVWLVDENEAVAHAWSFEGITQAALAPRRSTMAPAAGISRP